MENTSFWSLIQVMEVCEIVEEVYAELAKTKNMDNTPTITRILCLIREKGTRQETDSQKGK